MSKLLNEIGIITLITSLATILVACLHPNRPDWYEVEDPEVTRWSIDEARALELTNQPAGVLWVDARGSKKYSESHYPGAINLDLDEWETLLFDQHEAINAALDLPVIVYCDGTRCQKSKQVAKRLRELVGLDPVYLLKGNWRTILSEGEKR